MKSVYYIATIITKKSLLALALYFAQSFIYVDNGHYNATLLAKLTRHGSIIMSCASCMQDVVINSHLPCQLSHSQFGVLNLISQSQFLYRFRPFSFLHSFYFDILCKSLAEVSQCLDTKWEERFWWYIVCCCVVSYVRCQCIVIPLHWLLLSGKRNEKEMKMWQEWISWGEYIEAPKLNAKVIVAIINNDGFFRY